MTRRGRHHRVHRRHQDRRHLRGLRPVHLRRYHHAGRGSGIRHRRRILSDPQRPYCGIPSEPSPLRVFSTLRLKLQPAYEMTSKVWCREVSRGMRASECRSWVEGRADGRGNPAPLAHPDDVPANRAASLLAARQSRRRGVDPGGSWRARPVVGGEIRDSGDHARWVLTAARPDRSPDRPSRRLTRPAPRGVRSYESRSAPRWRRLPQLRRPRSRRPRGSDPFSWPRNVPAVCPVRNSKRSTVSWGADCLRGWWGP